MRFPVFARRSNPSVDAPILRKSKTYIEKQIEEGRADWVNPLDPRKGIVCREMLYFGERKFTPEEGTGAGGYLYGLKFIPPPMEKNPLIARVEVEPLFKAEQGWDWSCEIPAAAATEPALTLARPAAELAI